MEESKDMKVIIIFKRGVKHALKKNKLLPVYKDHEDFGMYCVEKFLEGAFFNVNCSFIDYLRQDSGRKGSGSYEDRSQKHLEFDPIRHGYSENSYEEKLNNKLRLKYFYNKVSTRNDRDREIIRLWLNQYSLKEIGDEMGITTSRAHQIIERAIIESRSLEWEM